MFGCLGNVRINVKRIYEFSHTIRYRTKDRKRAISIQKEQCFNQSLCLWQINAEYGCDWTMRVKSRAVAGSILQFLGIPIRSSLTVLRKIQIKYTNSFPLVHKQC